MVGQSLNYTNVMLDILAITWNVDPEIFHIGGLSIRYYSILFVSGFIIGWYIFRHFFKNEGIQVSPLLDYLLYTLLIATIVGARLGHCLFYQPDYYFGSWAGFAEIFMPWKGGLASHGGAIALIIAMIWFGFVRWMEAVRQISVSILMKSSIIPMRFRVCRHCTIQRKKKEKRLSSR